MPGVGWPGNTSPSASANGQSAWPGWPWETTLLPRTWWPWPPPSPPRAPQGGTSPPRRKRRKPIAWPCGRPRRPPATSTRKPCWPGSPSTIARTRLFKKAAERLLEIAPDEIATQHVAFIHALAEGRFDDAEAALERAHELGMPRADCREVGGRARRGATPRCGPAFHDRLGGGRVGGRHPRPPGRGCRAERGRPPRSRDASHSDERPGPRGEREPEEGLRDGALALLRLLLRFPAPRGPRGRPGRGRDHLRRSSPWAASP